MTSPFSILGAAICRDQRFAKLLRDLEAHSRDGTEADREIDQALPGLENRDAATRIKRAVEAKYRGSVPVATAIEMLLALLEDDGGLE